MTVSALNEPIDMTLSRWSTEALELENEGAYDWLCSRVKFKRILEIGCGFGVSTQAMVRNGKTVFCLDNQMECLQAAQLLAPEVTYGLADLRQIPDQLVQDLDEFAPESMVIWMAGAPGADLPTNVPEQYAVMQYRLVFQQAALTLASRVASIQTVHIADKTMFPWAMKNTGKQTMAQLLKTSVIGSLPFIVDTDDIQFRKLNLSASTKLASRLSGLSAVLGEATIRRM